MNPNQTNNAPAGAAGGSEPLSLTPENKAVIARVFGLYWGCDVWVGGQVMPMDSLFPDDDFENIKLALTPLEKISDPDAVELAKITSSTLWDKTCEILKIKRRETYLVIEYRWKHENPRLNNEDGYAYSAIGFSLTKVEGVEQFQYLTRKGYAVPLFFAPGHPLNGQTGIEIGIAVDKTQLIN